MNIIYGLPLKVLAYLGSLTICLAQPNLNRGAFHSSVKDKLTWRNKGADFINRKLSSRPNTNIAKNIIVFIGDGMGVTTVTAARILDGQQKGLYGEENELYFESFEHTALSKTYSLDKMTPDSASTATAILSGVKTKSAILGLDGNAVLNNCSHSLSYAEKLDTILDWAQKAGKRTGIVTTARVTHATPAAAYAHTPNRNWEGDANMYPDDAACKDIARQLIEDNKNINVILGGGRRYFLPDTTVDPETGRVERGQRGDGRDLIQDWIDDKKARDKSYHYVWNRSQFLQVDGNTEYLLGLFSPSHMEFERDRIDYGVRGEPSLAEMTNKAIDILSKGRQGYFLLVEGARIDHGHHSNLAKKALYDVIAFDRAVQVAGNRPEAGPKTTQSIVTADHSHVFNIVGNPLRGTDILGLVQGEVGLARDLNGKPYTVLHYSNGPSVSQHFDLTFYNTTEDWFRFPAGYPLSRETHGGEDVTIYAKGPMSHLVRGTQEQTCIAYIMAYSACIGPFYDDKNTRSCSHGRMSVSKKGNI